jgi:hypothetical protein
MKELWMIIFGNYRRQHHAIQATDGNSSHVAVERNENGISLQEITRNTMHVPEKKANKALTDES